MSIYARPYSYMFNVIQTNQAPLLPAASTHIKHHQTMALKHEG